MKKAVLVTVCWMFLAFIFCPGVFAGTVPDTGQTGCYTDFIYPITCPDMEKPEDPNAAFAGQDANYNDESNQPSYTKLDVEGKPLADDATEWAMVLDNVTGLIWEVKQDKDGTQNYANPHDADNKYTWYDSTLDAENGQAGKFGEGKNTEEFIKKLNENKFGGFSDWRLPTIRELTSIVNKDTYEPSLYKDSNGKVVFFTNVNHDKSYLTSYWSSTPDPNPWANPNPPYDKKYALAFSVDFRYGIVKKIFKSTSFCAMAVRGSSLKATLIENEDGKTVTDRSTGLVWQKEKADAAKSWQGALAYCQDLPLADSDDWRWRLPNVNELLSLIDYDKPVTQLAPAAVNSILQNHTEPAYYWSSTTQLVASASESYQHACIVNFSNGECFHQTKSISYYVRAVRGPLPITELFGIADAIVCLQIASGTEFEAGEINFFDVDGDGKMGPREAAWALQVAAGIRTKL